MKKTFLAFLLFSTIIVAKANPVSDSLAKVVGYNFLSTKFSASKLGSISNLLLAYKAVDSNTLSKITVCYYVFNVTTTKGFVIVSADDNVSPILAYSTESNYGMVLKNPMPKQISDWFGGYARRVAVTIKNNTKATNDVKIKWQQLSSPLPKSHFQLFGSGTGSVNPLLPTYWDQNSEDGGSTIFYNNQCPYDKKFGANVETGCVATAMAQVMRYWKYPTKGTGEHTYTPVSYPYLGSQTFDFGNTTYQWNLMPDSLGLSSTQAQINAVGTLIYSCGVAVDMDYGADQVDGSGSQATNYGGYYANTAQDALVNYFNYDNRLQGLSRSNYTDADWMNILQNELNAKRPVIYTGSGDQGGHCFINDGYDNNNLFHFNWGWSGYYNGFYDINNMSPGSDTFNYGQQAVIGIQPKYNFAANASDSLALIAFYNSATGSSWTNNSGWLKGPVSTWYGVLLDSTGKVTALSLSGNNLSGTIDPAIANLNKLTTLDLSINNFSGSIPQFVLNLGTVRTLDLSYNKFTGTIPNINNGKGFISTLDLSNNQLTGTIPNSFDSLFNLVTLDVSNNKLSGTLPTLIDDTNYISTLSIANNLYSGTVPANFLSGIKYINDLDLSGNQYSGSFPTGVLNLPYLGNLDLSDNQFTGALPSTISTISPYLTQLILANNQFSGTIPTSIADLTSITYLDLSNNQFSGAVTQGFASLTGLLVFDISGNKLTFTGMNYVAKVSNGNNSIVYGPQALLKLNVKGTKLSCGAGGTLSQNTYKWYYVGGSLVSTKKGDSTYSPTVGGSYYAAITNSTATGLTLYTDTLVGGPLPVTLESITATLTNGKTVIDWITANELNTQSFVIEHSTDASTYSVIGNVKAVGSGANNYTFTDNSPVNGINYYRLKSVDIDGAFTYSKVVSVQLTINKNKLLVYPNPSRDNILITGTHLSSLQVIDNLGRVVKVISLVDASNPTVNISTLQAGAYHLRVQTTDGNVSVATFIKE
jgi:Leucine-rich repeat (LRR) protein